MCGIAPLLQADLRASQRLQFFAKKASPFGAGASVAPITDELWWTLHNLNEKEGGSTRLPLRWSSRHRGAQVLRSLPRRFVCTLRVHIPRFRSHQRARAHCLTSLLRNLANRGARKHRILCCVDSRVVLGVVSKGRTSQRRLNFGLRRLAFECLSATLSIDSLWVPSWSNPADAPSRGASLARWRRSLPAWPPQVPSVHFGPAAVARELKLVREPLSEAAVYQAREQNYFVESRRELAPVAPRHRQRRLPTSAHLSGMQTDVMGKSEVLVDSEKSSQFTTSQKARVGLSKLPHWCKLSKPQGVKPSRHGSTRIFFHSAWSALQRNFFAFFLHAVLVCKNTRKLAGSSDRGFRRPTQPLARLAHKNRSPRCAIRAEAALLLVDCAL